jgi:hypothetical protein
VTYRQREPYYREKEVSSNFSHLGRRQSPPAYYTGIGRSEKQLSWNPRRANTARPPKPAAKPNGNRLAELQEESYRPNSHPSNEEIMSRPLYELQAAEGGYFYQRISETDFLVLGQDDQTALSRREKEKRQFGPGEGPILFCSDLRHPQQEIALKGKIPIPAKLKSELFQPPFTRPSGSRTHVEACKCVSTNLGPQMEYVTTPICLKENLIQRKSMLVRPGGAGREAFYPNMAKTYRQGVLQVPQPWGNNFCWQYKPFTPTLALDKSNLRSELFYALHDSDRYREQVEPFLESPSTWIPGAGHPWGAEPGANDELYAWSSRLYGTETLFRTLYPAHPGRGHRLPVLSAMDLSAVEYPTLVGCTDLTGIDKFIAIVLRPFYQKGHGKVVCSVCILRPARAGYPVELLSLTRSEYRGHYERCHARFHHFSGLAFSTGYGTRIHEATVLYHMILGSQTFGMGIREKPSPTLESLPALDSRELAEQFWDIEYYKLHVTSLSRPQQNPQGKPQPGPQGAEGGEEAGPMDTEEVQVLPQ